MAYTGTLACATWHLKCWQRGVATPLLLLLTPPLAPSSQHVMAVVRCTKDAPRHPHRSRRPGLVTCKQAFTTVCLLLMHVLMVVLHCMLWRRWTLHVIDTDDMSLGAQGWLEDVSKVEKYVMSDEDYSRRDNTYRKFKEGKLKEDPSWTLEKEMAARKGELWGFLGCRLGIRLCARWRSM